jgi:hypothetical protein
VSARLRLPPPASADRRHRGSRRAARSGRSRDVGAWVHLWVVAGEPTPLCPTGGCRKMENGGWRKDTRYTHLIKELQLLKAFHRRVTFGAPEMDYR